jgi:hypothetical protein
MKKVELEKYIGEIRPKADAYDRVCKKINRDGNIIGHIDDLDDQINKMDNRRAYWEKQSKLHGKAEEYYRTELAKAHELLGRVIHQNSERWDSVRLTEYYPTDNLHSRRTIENPNGKS